MPQSNDFPFRQDETLVAVVEMSKTGWPVAGMIPGVARRPLKKLVLPDEKALFELLERWRDEAVKTGKIKTRWPVPLAVPSQLSSAETDRSSSADFYSGATECELQLTFSEKRILLAAAAERVSRRRPELMPSEISRERRLQRVQYAAIVGFDQIVSQYALPRTGICTEHLAISTIG